MSPSKVNTVENNKNTKLRFLNHLIAESAKQKAVFKCFGLKLTKMIFKGCLGNLDNELRPFPYRREKNPSMLGGDVERLIVPVCTGS